MNRRNHVRRIQKHAKKRRKDAYLVYNKAYVTLVAFITHWLPAGTAVPALTPETDFTVGAATITCWGSSNAFATLARGVIVAEVVGAAVCVGEAACDINCAEAILHIPNLPSALRKSF